MSVFSRLFKPKETKTSTAGPIISSWQVGQPVWSGRDYAAFADEGYVRNVVSFRCVKMISTGAASIPWLLYNGKTEVTEHPILNLLKQPAPGIGGLQLFEAWYSYLLIAGNGYMEGVGPSQYSEPKELWTHRPDRMKVIPGSKGTPKAYRYTVNGQHRDWRVDQLSGRGPIMHVKEFNPLDDWYGMGRTDPAAYSIDRHNAAQAHNKALLDNGARPSGVLVFEPVSNSDGTTTSAPKEVITAAEQRLHDRHGGPENAGKPLVLGGNVSWHGMGMSPRDMDFNAGKDDSARDICTAWGVPHTLIVPGQSTYNNVHEARLELWENTILPLFNLTLSGLNEWLCPRYSGNLRLAPDLDAISALEPRRETKRAGTMELLEKGVIDTDEAREELQYGPRKAGAVKKIDAPVLTALLAGVPQFGIDPLVTYMKSVGLYDASKTVEQIVADVGKLIESDDLEEEGVEDDESTEEEI